MNKSQLAAKVALASGISQKQARDLLNVVVDSLIEALNEGERVCIRGLGSFEVREHKEKAGRNPQTGERILLPPRATIGFTISRSLRDSLERRS